MDRKIAFLFSGQGAQYVGMGKELCERYTEAEKVFDFISQVSGKNMKEQCFRSKIEDLSLTQNTQLALFTVEASILAVLKKYNINPDVVAGFSIGEYGALYASGIFDLMTCVYLVNQRANVMNKACVEGGYGMGAITGGNISKINKLCSKYDEVWVSNYNSNEQVSITGRKSSVQKVIEEAISLNYKAIELNVSGAFHSPIMKNASEEFEESTKIIRAKENKIPIVLNVTGEYYNVGDDILQLMVKQIYSPVHWSKSINLMLKDGVTDFIEIGPGKVLSNFVRNIIGDKSINIMNVQDMESLSETIDKIYN